MYINIIKSYRDVVAVCDSELLGQKFEENQFQLDVKESFFKGEKFSEEKIIEILKDMKKEDATFNLIGERTVDIAIKAGVVSEKNVGKIKEVPYALILL